jgi:thiosulfate dehydrogenase
LRIKYLVHSNTLSLNPLFKQLVRRLAFLFITLTAAILGVAILILNADFSSSPKAIEIAPDEIELWDSDKLILSNPKVPDLVKKGYYLVAESAAYMGPLASNPEARFSGNRLSCTNCHLNGGTLSGSASWIGILDRFPQFRGRENKIGSIEDRINGCMERSMNGKKLPDESQQMAAIVAYMEWISTSVPTLNTKDFKGYPSIKIPEMAVDLSIGKTIYLRECALCHGIEGKGIRYADEKKGYQYPPLWGDDSYNDGAGMHRVLTAAAFIKNNMPYLQATWENPKLTDEEAFHVAGYINHFQRPEKQNKTADFPDKTLKPVSTPYGPWTDNFSAQQHKYGPFPPMIAYYKNTYGLTKTK